MSHLLSILMNSDTASSASNNFWLGSNKSAKVRTFTVNNKRIKKVPFSEMEDSFLKQDVLKHDMGKWTSFRNDINYNFIVLGRLLH